MYVPFLRDRSGRLPVLTATWIGFHQCPAVHTITQSIQELGVGTFKQIEMIQMDKSVMDAARIMASKRFSSLPIVNNENQLIDVFTEADVLVSCLSICL
jgi:predicted transcriptional regulator